MILIFPLTIDAWVIITARGREARGVQAVAPGRRVITEEEADDISPPPAITNACTKGGFVFGLSPL